MPLNIFKNIKGKGYLALCGGVLIHITLGTFYTFGNMNTYMTSYIKIRINRDADYSQSIWINAMAILGQGITMALGGYLENRFGARLACLLGCFGFSGFIMLTYYTIQYGLVGVAATYGLLACMGLGLAYVPPLSVAMKWFPERKGLVNGLTVGGFGLGALIFNQVQSVYLNPSNLVPKDDGYFDQSSILNKVPQSFVFLGGIYAAIQVIGIILLCSPDSEVERQQLLSSQELSASGSDDYTETKEVLNERVDSSYSLAPREVLRTREFYMLFATFAFNSQSVQFINTLYKAFGQTFISDDHYLATVGSLASICNAGGRIIWGHLYDRSSYRTTMLILSFVLTVLMLTFQITSLDGKTVFTIWIFGIFFTFSGLFVIFPTVTAETFGPKYAGTNYGFLFIAPATSSLLGAFLIQQTQSFLHWFGSFCLISGFAMIGGIITVFFPSNPAATVLKKYMA